MLSWLSTPHPNQSGLLPTCVGNTGAVGPFSQGQALPEVAGSARAGSCLQAYQQLSSVHGSIPAPEPLFLAAFDFLGETHSVGYFLKGALRSLKTEMTKLWLLWKMAFVLASVPALNNFQRI